METKRMVDDNFAALASETARFFAFTMVELTVLFIGISFLVGLINEFLPQDKVKNLLSGRRGRGYLIGSLLGGLTPFCSCSTIPVTVGLLRANAGFGPTMAFLFTSPLVNPIIVPLFLTLLGTKVTVIYVIVAIGMTIGISYLLDRLGFVRYVGDNVVSRQQSSPESSNHQAMPGLQTVSCCSGSEEKGIGQIPTLHQFSSDGSPAPAASLTPFPMYVEKQSRWRRIFNEAVKQFKDLLPFVILGVAIGSVIHGFLPANLVADLAGADNPLAVPVSAFIGIPLYLRVSTMVPIAASLIAKGMSTGAVVALIIGGAGASLPEVAMLRGIFKTPLLLAFLASVMCMAITAGFLINMVVV